MNKYMFGEYGSIDVDFIAKPEGVPMGYFSFCLPRVLGLL